MKNPKPETQILKKTRNPEKNPKSEIVNKKKKNFFQYLKKKNKILTRRSEKKFSITRIIKIIQKIF